MQEYVNRTSLVALGLGLGAAVSLGTWWLLRGKVTFDPESFQRPLGRVSQINVYPLKSGRSIEMDSTECFIRGLAYDRYFLGLVVLL